MWLDLYSGQRETTQVHLRMNLRHYTHVDLRQLGSTITWNHSRQLGSTWDGSQVNLRASDFCYWWRAIRARVEKYLARLTCSARCSAAAESSELSSRLRARMVRARLAPALRCCFPWFCVGCRVLWGGCNPTNPPPWIRPCLVCFRYTPGDVSESEAESGCVLHAL